MLSALALAPHHRYRWASANLPASCPRYAPPRAEIEQPELEVILRELEMVRDYVSNDVASAAMRAVRERRSLDAFISDLQDQVAEAGSELENDFELSALSFEEQANALGLDQTQ